MKKIIELEVISTEDLNKNLEKLLQKIKKSLKRLLPILAQVELKEDFSALQLNIIFFSDSVYRAVYIDHDAMTGAQFLRIIWELYSKFSLQGEEREKELFQLEEEILLMALCVCKSAEQSDARLSYEASLLHDLAEFYFLHENYQFGEHYLDQSYALCMIEWGDRIRNIGLSEHVCNSYIDFFNKMPNKNHLVKAQELCRRCLETLSKMPDKDSKELKEKYLVMAKRIQNSFEIASIKEKVINIEEKHLNIKRNSPGKKLDEALNEKTKLTSEINRAEQTIKILNKKLETLRDLSKSKQELVDSLKKKVLAHEKAMKETREAAVIHEKEGKKQHTERMSALQEKLNKLSVENSQLKKFAEDRREQPKPVFSKKEESRPTVDLLTVKQQNTQKVEEQKLELINGQKAIDELKSSFKEKDQLQKNKYQEYKNTLNAFLEARNQVGNHLLLMDFRTHQQKINSEIKALYGEVLNLQIQRFHVLWALDRQIFQPVLQPTVSSSYSSSQSMFSFFQQQSTELSYILDDFALG